MMERLAQWWRGLRLPFFMALRYLVSRRRVGAANIISAISALGVAFGTAALICTLSVFNGFHDLVGGLLTNFDPQLMIEPAKGKFAAADDPALTRVMNMAEVESASACLEDNALILFRGRPLVITIKGVDEHYDKAPTSLPGQVTQTSPYGRDVKTAGFPIKVCELLSSLDGPQYIERVAVNNVKNVLSAKKAIEKAFRNQIEGKGFSLIEVLSSCPTNWGTTPQEALDRIESDMIPYYPLGVYKDSSVKGGSEK